MKKILESVKKWKEGKQGQRKKKSLCSIWFGVWGPLFVITLIAIGAGTGYVYSNVEEELATGFEDWVENGVMATNWDTALANLDDYETKKQQEKEIFALQAKINLLWSNGIYGVIYDKDGEIVETTQTTVYFGYRPEEDKEKIGAEYMQWYQCGSEKIANEICAAYSKYKQSGYNAYKFEQVYVSDGIFFPQKMVFLKDDVPVKTLTFSLENEDLTMYTYLGDLLAENEDGEYRCSQFVSILGYEDPVSGRYWDEEYLEYLKGIKNPQESETYAYYDHDFNKEEAQSYQKITVGNNDYYVLFGKMYHPFTVIQKDVYVAVVTGIIFTMLFALAIAANFYRIYKKELILQERQKEFSNALAHDLKTPMMAISGYTENLAEQIHPEKQEYYIEGIQSNISYMNELVGQILELAKVDHTIELQKEIINVRDMAQKIVTIHEKMAEEKQMEVHITGENTIYADAGYMERVFANVIKNALEFSPEQQSVFIRIEETYVEITNTGVEIPAEQLEEMWKPFVKGDKSRSRESGHGLGLAIVKEILDMHGFRYEMTSENQKVTVRIYF